MSNWKLKKEFEKGNLEELIRLQTEMSLVDPNSEEYKKLSERHAELAKIANEKTANDVKTRNTVIDNVCGFIGVAISVFFPVVLGRIPSPQAWTFSKNKQKHNN